MDFNHRPPGPALGAQWTFAFCKLLILKDWSGRMDLNYNQASESHKRFIWRRLRDKKRYFPPLSCTYLVPSPSVDVAGTEPATPCLQSKLRNAMWLSRLAFTYVVVHGVGRCLAVCVPTLFPPFSRLHAHSETVYLSHDLHHDAISG